MFLPFIDEYVFVFVCSYACSYLCCYMFCIRVSQVLHVWTVRFKTGLLLPENRSVWNAKCCVETPQHPIFRHVLAFEISGSNKPVLKRTVHICMRVCWCALTRVYRGFDLRVFREREVVCTQSNTHITALIITASDVCFTHSHIQSTDNKDPNIIASNRSN